MKKKKKEGCVATDQHLKRVEGQRCIYASQVLDRDPSEGRKARIHWRDNPSEGVWREPLRVRDCPGKSILRNQHRWWWFSCSVVSDSCDLMDCSPPGSSVHGILQARTLEWVAISFSRGSSWPRDWTQVSCIAGRFFTDWAKHRRAPGKIPLGNLRESPLEMQT